MVLPAAFVVVHYLQTRNKNDLVQGLLGNRALFKVISCVDLVCSFSAALTLGLCLNGVVTNVIKLCVGRYGTPTNRHHITNKLDRIWYFPSSIMQTPT